jgi:hypothetical protein
MQECRLTGEFFWRCPWTKDYEWTIETHTIPKQLFCGGKPLGRRIPGGIRIDSVA